MLRPSTPADLPFIKEAVSSWSLDPESLDEGTWLIAVTPDNAPIAFGRLKHHRGFLELANIGVAPEHRNSGVATRLVNALIAQADAQPLWLATRIPDFFKKFGFVVDFDAPKPLADKIARHCHNTAVTMQYQRS